MMVITHGYKADGEGYYSVSHGTRRYAETVWEEDQKGWRLIVDGEKRGLWQYYKNALEQAWGAFTASEAESEPESGLLSDIKAGATF